MALQVASEPLEAAPALHADKLHHDGISQQLLDDNRVQDLPALIQLVNTDDMNFVIFSMFFMSSALYPIWKMRKSSDLLARICEFNPFTHAIEAIRFAFYGQFNGTSMAILYVRLCFLTVSAALITLPGAFVPGVLRRLETLRHVSSV